MIGIGLVYACIIAYEWFYLTRKKRKRRTFFVVLGIALLLWMGAETLYVLRDRSPLAKVLESVFDPLEKVIARGGADHG